ncbi:TauD/TfdA dioxygenase family protein [Methylomonas rivi]|uniref:TauD/TfdA family dioxygenase n=1 Tax=Methylomonas rivi TaxID=2952226 RepID=A0ABT1U8Q5_9GAMM|nr:TauD/TfdA family dioxygenase [Methylomonas sp. WSC-6]MCQ8129471.1 TauD/TfdA family dioxygenase [Methylomonas sp. WSC-6]
MTILNFTKNHNGVGVTVNNVNIAAGLTHQQIDQMRKLLHRYRVVILRNQLISDTHLTDFAFQFGPPFIPDNSNPVLGSAEGGSHLVIVGNRADEYRNAYLGNQEVLPHSDHQWLQFPSSASILYAVDVSSNAAPTIWTDMVQAYALLDEDMKETIKGLNLITYNPFFRPFGSVSATYVDRRIETPPGPFYPHPLVRTHSETGEKVLYLNAAYEVELPGIAYETGVALIAKLHNHLQSLDAVYKHVWQNGDIVFWDNQATIHYRPPFNENVRRILKRVSIAGGAPF